MSRTHSTNQELVLLLRFDAALLLLLRYAKTDLIVKALELLLLCAQPSLALGALYARLALVC